MEVVFKIIKFFAHHPRIGDTIMVLCLVQMVFFVFPLVLVAHLFDINLVLGLIGIVVISLPFQFVMIWNDFTIEDQERYRRAKTKNELEPKGPSWEINLI